MKDTLQKLSGVSVALHWIVGVTIIALLTVGWGMATFEIDFLYTPHKSVGILIFAVILARVWWRAINGFPKAHGNPPKWQEFAARAVHCVLLIGSILMPITGIGMSVQGGNGLEIFSLELLAENIDPASGETIAINAAMAGAAHNAHNIIGKIMMATIAIHILGALKHHLIDKDNTLRRMLGKSAG